MHTAEYSNLLSLLSQYCQLHPTALSPYQTKTLSFTQLPLQSLTSILSMSLQLQTLNLIFTDDKQINLIPNKGIISRVQGMKSGKDVDIFFPQLKQLSIEKFSQHPNDDEIVERIVESGYKGKVNIQIWNKCTQDQIESMKRLSNPIILNLKWVTNLSKQTVSRLLQLSHTLIQLKLFSITLGDPSHLIEIVNKLQSLSTLFILNSPINVPNQITVFELIHLKSHIKQLQFYKIYIDHLNLPRILSNNPEVQSLYFNNCNISDKVLQYLPSEQQSKISKLQLHDNLRGTLITQLGIRTIIDKYPNLVQLNLVNCERIGNKAVKLIATHLIHLVSLTLYSCKLNNRGALYLRKLKGLENLKITANGVSKSVVEKILMNMKCLTEKNLELNNFNQKDKSERQSKLKENLKQGFGINH